MAIPPDLNSPEQQRAYQEEQERQRQAEAARNAPTGVEQSWAGEAADTVANTATGAIDDFFSAEEVGGPGRGTWGASGTPAAGYNAGMAAQGGQIAAGAKAEGQAASGAANSTATNLLGQAGGAGSRTAPTTNWAGADQYASKADSAREVANGLINQAGSSTQQDAQLAALNQFAGQGPGPSAAQAQLAGASDAAQRSALSMARSGRGAGDSASALRDATFSNAATQATTGQNMAALRAQEEATFRQQQLQALDAAMGGAGAIRAADTSAAQLAQGTRSQDLQAQGQAADQSKFNTTTQQTQTQLNDAAKQGLINSALGYTSEGNQTNLGFQGLGLGAETDRLQLGQNALNAQADYELGMKGMQIDAEKANQQADLEKDSGVSGMVSAGLGLIGLSDERAKELEQRESALAAMLDTLGNAPAYSYKYKNPDQPGAAHGRQVSSMAQDLERGPMGDTIVIDTPQGKMVNYEQTVKMTPGALTELNHKVEALEAALGKKKAA